MINRVANVYGISIDSCHLILIDELGVTNISSKLEPANLHVVRFCHILKQCFFINTVGALV